MTHTTTRSFDTLSNEEKTRLETLEWNRTFMTKVERRNDHYEHITPDGRKYEIIKTPEWTWDIIGPEGKTTYNRRKEGIHYIARRTAEILYNEGREVGRWSLTLEKENIEAAKKKAEAEKQSE